jgi:hypothetical protein
MSAVCRIGGNKDAEDANSSNCHQAPMMCCWLHTQVYAFSLDDLSYGDRADHSHRCLPVCEPQLQHRLADWIPATALSRAEAALLGRVSVMYVICAMPHSWPEPKKFRGSAVNGPTFVTVVHWRFDRSAAAALTSKLTHLISTV